MSDVWMPPRFGPWQETEQCIPSGSQYVLGFYGDAPCVKTKVVYCDGVPADEEDEGDEAGAQWCGIDNEEVDAPACWAEIIYPEEDE
jgi:hypothetical protein